LTEDEDARAIISSGAEIAGPIVAQALQALGVPGPVATITLPVVKLGSELFHRFLGPREKVRVGAGAAYAVARIQWHIDRQHKARNDGFFDSDPTGRSKATELLEGVLLKCRDSYEEKKVKYLGYFYANVAFSSTDPTIANYIISIVGRLTYTQLCCISLFANRASFSLSAHNYQADRSIPSWTTAFLLQEIYELSIAGLVMSEVGNIVVGPASITPAKMILTALGENVFQLMSLSEVPRSDVDNLVSALQ